MATPVAEMKKILKAYDSLSLRKSPPFEYTLAWLKRRAPKSKKREDTPEWWSLLDTASRCKDALSRGAAFRSEGSSDLSDGLAARQASELELECLLAIAHATSGGPEAVLQNMEGTKKVSKLRADEDEEEGDPSTPSNLELVLGVRKLLAEQFAQDPAAKAAEAALALVARDLEQGPDDEMTEAISLAHLLSHPPLSCFKCGAVVGSKVDGTVLKQMRTELTGVLRNSQIPIDKPGLLRYLLVTTARHLAVDQPDCPTLVPIRSML